MPSTAMQTPLIASGVETLNKVQNTPQLPSNITAADHNHDTPACTPLTLREDDSNSASDWDSSSCQTFVTASSALLGEDLSNSSSEVASKRLGHRTIVDWASAVEPSEGSVVKIPEPSFHFSLPLPHSLVTGQDSPLTSDMVEMADMASIQYDALQSTVSPRLYIGDSSITDKIVHSVQDRTNQQSVR